MLLLIMKIIAKHTTIWIESPAFEKLTENETFALNQVLSNLFKKAMMNYHSQLIVKYDNSKFSQKEVLSMVRVHLKSVKDKNHS